MKGLPGIVEKDPAQGELQTLCGVWNDPVSHPGFVDLRPLQDDKTVLQNPHKGWFWHYIDNGLTSPWYRGETPEQDDLPEFPGLNHLYLRVDWGDIEKEEGVYDFGFMEDILQRWGAKGYRFSLRFCTYEGRVNANFATLEYVYRAGARGFLLPDGCLQPDYADPIFLEKLENFLKAAGARFDGDDRIELVDIGTYGTWGEGHTVEGSMEIYPLEVIKKHIDLHVKYFPKSFLVMNDDMITGRMAHGQAECQQVLNYAKARGVGLQDDSICLEGYTENCGYDSMRSPWAFEELYQNAPSVIEFCHYGYIHPRLECNYRGGLTVIEALKNSHATFAGFHGYPREWIENQRFVSDYCANRLGYWYFIHWVQVPVLVAGAHNRFEIKVENRGWAPAYHAYQLRVRLRGQQGSFVRPVPCENRAWQPDTPVTLSLPMDATGVPAGEYFFELGLFEGERPVRLALKDSCFCDSFYTLCTTTVQAL